MLNIYTAVYVCTKKGEIGLPGYSDVMLEIGTEGSGTTAIVIRGTCADFKVGKEYLISIAEVGR